MTHIMNLTSSEKTIDSLVAGSHTLAQSFDFAGKILIIYVTSKRLTCAHRDIGSKISSEGRNQAEFELDTFRAWFHENVLKKSSDSLSDAVVVLPAGKATPDYRDEPNPFAHHVHSASMVKPSDTGHEIGLQTYLKFWENTRLQWC